MQGGGEKQVPVTYILQQYNQAKAVHKLPDEERAILSAGEIARMKEAKHEQAREEQRKRREYMKMREEEARSPEPIVPTLERPDPPLPPVFDALQDTYRYRYNENQAGWIVRPFVDSNGPDRSDGINGGQAERHGTLRLPNQYIGGAPSRVLFQVLLPTTNACALSCLWKRPAAVGGRLCAAGMDAVYWGAMPRREPRGTPSLVCADSEGQGQHGAGVQRRDVRVHWA
ncbi:MAG: hypothetical protein HC767_06845 [Akkermansiaceae bacterium]|nr:hypothetical protein [Akkermansiaceae bacterium]